MSDSTQTSKPDRQESGKALPYARAPGSRQRSRRLLWSLLIVGGLVALSLVVNWGLDYGHRWECCTLCGAQSDVRHLYLFGMGVDYGRRVRDGPLSKFIQEHDGRLCAHQWQFVSGHYGNLTGQARATGRGLAPGWVSHLETLPAPRVRVVLENRLADDPGFPGRLKQAVRFPLEQTSEDLLQELIDEAYQETERNSPPKGG